MSLNLLAVQDQIFAQLDDNIAQDVYINAVPEDKKITHGPDGLFNPYVVITFGDMTESAGQAGIISSRYNVGTSYCIVSSVAPTERAARQVSELVREQLTGFQPTDAGELRLAGGRNYNQVTSTAVPNHYISEVNYIFAVNTVW